MNIVVNDLGEAAGGFANTTAEMIRPLSDKGANTRCSFLSQEFDVAEVSGDEVLRITAQGLYVCFVNGERVANDILTPGWTCYDVRLSYQTYAVGDLLKPGQNEIEIWLADGWYRSQMMWAAAAAFNVWGSDVAAIAEISGGSDGSAILLKTDKNWKSGLLPVMRSGIYFGEVYDARCLVQTTAGVEPVAFDNSRLVAHEISPIRELAALEPIATWKEGDATVYDFGQNSAGYVSFAADGEAGDQVHIEHAEVVDENGKFNNVNLRTAEARVDYTLKGGGEENYRPLFTFHGFRYAKIKIDGAAKLSNIRSIPLSSLGLPSGSLSTGNELVNKLVQNTLWSQWANFLEVPTDCPQRDERMGWTGDAQVFAPTACYFHDCEAFFEKYLRDLMVDQRENGAIPHVCPDPTRLITDGYFRFENFFGSTGWGDAICVIPWTLWTHYGNRTILEETLPAMTRWVDYVWSISDGPIVRPPRERETPGFSFGDWLQPGGPTNKPLPTIGDDAAATIYLFIASTLTAKVARVLGETGIATAMEARAQEVKAAFATEFITPSGRLAYDDQTSYALAILYDLIPADKFEAAKVYFKATIARAEGRIGTGFIGTPALLPALTKIGEIELAADMFLQEEVPGWLYQVKMGATSIWERWDALFPDGSINGEQMNSYNHYAYGAVCQWLFEQVGGIRPDPETPGFEHILFEPTVIERLSPFSAEVASPHGPIAVNWETDGKTAVINATIPEGARATLRLNERHVVVQVDGAKVAADADGVSTEVLEAGTHEIKFKFQI